MTSTSLTSISPAEAQETEILIVGGGLVGMAMAAALGGAGIPVILVESEKLPDLTGEAFDGRSSAIAYGSQQVLSGIGAWEHIAPFAEPIRDIRVSDGGWQFREASPFFVHYHFADLDPASIPGAHGDRPPFGWIIENRAVRIGLVKRLQEIAAVTHVPGMRVDAIDFARKSNSRHIERWAPVAGAAGHRRRWARLRRAADGRDRRQGTRLQAQRHRLHRGA